ncbi:Carboxypeptidase N subunit 2 [Holothuria leucospilota]|uniref:Carboxypeptidase N subunit 2 n=1 Tax=Holothuria leucospilota TaxID=206669 RepID=A0A9Q0YK00_HOLLE|nr:Carboxypeptidase N subunit 2 [Holothuria leucospilota]
MTKVWHTLFSLIWGAVILDCATCFVVAQRDTSSVCSQLCPCRCLLTKSVFDCSNKSQTLNSLGEIMGGSCGSLRDFTTFNFSQNNFQDFNNFVMEGAGDWPSPCSLDLSHNKLTQVENLQFYRCRTISVDLSYNNLTNLLSIAVDLEGYRLLASFIDFKFNFSHNQITSLRDFIYMEPTFPFHTFGDNTELNFIIDLSFNLIATLSLPNFFFFMLPYRGMIFKNATISLHNNRISSLESYPNIDGFDNFNEPNILLDLRQNLLSSLPPPIGSTDPYSFHLSLEGNPWNCDCHQKWIADSSSKLRQIINNRHSTQPFCQHPENVKDRPLLSLKSVEFVCPPEVDRTVSLDYTPSLGDTVELICPLFGGDPAIENIEWKIWAKKDLQKSYFSLKTCANCSFVVNDIDHHFAGIYQCTAYNGIKVSSNISVSLHEELLAEDIDPASQMSCRGRCHIWPTIILLLLLVIVSFGFIFVSYKLYRASLSRFSMGTNPDLDRSNVSSSDRLSFPVSVPSLPVMSSTSTGSVDLTHVQEYREPTNKETPKADDDLWYEEVSYQRESGNAKTRDIEKSTDGNVSKVASTVRHQMTGLKPSYNNRKILTDRKDTIKNASTDEDDYEDTNYEQYSQLNVIHEYESHVSYQTLNLPQRTSSTHQ